MKRKSIFQFWSHYTFIDFAEEHGEVLFLPLFVLSISSIYDAISNGPSEAILLLDILLLLLLIVTLSIIVLKRKGKLHIIWLREIPNIIIYWAVFGIYFAVSALQKALERYYSGKFTSMMVFGIAAGTVSLLVLIFQTKPWLKIRYKDHFEQVELLKRKAKLNEKEWAALREYILQDANKRKKISFGWVITEIIFVLALTSLLDAYSNQIADAIQFLMP